MKQVKACVSALTLGVLMVTDGLNLYPRAIRQTFREPVATGKRGRRPGRMCVSLRSSKPIKAKHESGWSGGSCKGAQSKSRLRYKARGAGVLNTAFIERLNGAFRTRIAP